MERERGDSKERERVGEPQSLRGQERERRQGEGRETGKE